MEQDRAGPGTGAFGEEESQGQGPGGRGPAASSPAPIPALPSPASILLLAHSIFRKPTPESVSPYSFSRPQYKVLSKHSKVLHIQVQLPPYSTFLLPFPHPQIHHIKLPQTFCPSVHTRLVSLPGELLLNPPQPSPNVPTSVKPSPVSSFEGRTNSCPSILLP